MSDEHMWLVPLTEGEDHWLCVTFHQAMDMTGLRIWNYNKSAEDTYRGVSRNSLGTRQLSYVINNNNSIYLYSAIYPELKFCSEALVTRLACL